MSKLKAKLTKAARGAKAETEHAAGAGQAAKHEIAAERASGAHRVAEPVAESRQTAEHAASSHQSAKHEAAPGRRTLIWIVIGVVAAIVVAVLAILWISQPHVGDALVYQVSYSDDAIPGSTTTLKVFGDRITAQRTQNCSAEDCTPTVGETEQLDFDTANVQRVIKFLRDNFTPDDDGVISLSQSSLTERQRNIMNSILLGQLAFDIAAEEFEGRVEYEPNWHEVYHIYLKKDGSILVKKSTMDDEFAITSVDTYQLQFPAEQLEKLREFLQGMLDATGSTMYYHGATLRKDEQPFFQSIMENQLDYLTAEEPAELVYAVNYTGVNCLTPTLDVYADGSYELFDQYDAAAARYTAREGAGAEGLAEILNDATAAGAEATAAFIVNDAKDGSYRAVAADDAALLAWLSGLGVDLTACLEL